MVPAIEVGMADEQQFGSCNLPDRRVGNGDDRRFAAACHFERDAPF